MTATRLALLREWDFLQEQVVPPLLEVDHERSPLAWSVGSIEDAVSVAVAFDYAYPPAAAARDRMKSFAGPSEGALSEVGFGRSDLRGVPATSKDAHFTRKEDRWVAGDAIARQVLLADPCDQVDLITVRAGSARLPASLEPAIRLLRPGGQLLLISPEGEDVPVPSVLEPVDASAGGAVYRKQPGRQPAPVDGEAACDGPVETLAHRRSVDQLVISHVRLARSLARRFAHHGESMDDLEQVAMVALVKAARRFDPSRDIRFATYATSSILGELKRHFRDKTWMMRVPRSVQELYLSVKQARDDLTHQLGAMPTVGQVAEHLETTPDAVLDAMHAGDNFWPESLDGNRNREQGGTEIPVIDESLEQSMARVQLQQLLPRLDQREHFVLKRVYFDNCTQRDVAKELDVSQMQVSRILARALSELRGS
jgi:RNA polymerase sigma-B factor